MKPTTAQRGKLITFEGIECSGKGTQIKLVEKFVREELRQSCTSDHEPGGTLYGEAMRAILKNPELALPGIFNSVRKHSDYPDAGHFADYPTDYGRNGLVEMYLFMVSRSLYAEKIKKLLDKGFFVLSDRLMDSTTAYQGYGKSQGDPKMLEAIDFNNRLAMDGLWPNLTLFLDIPVEVMYERMASQSDEKNSFFEKKYDQKFYERVRQGYLNIAKKEQQRFKVIDSSLPINLVFELIKKEIEILI